MWDDLLNAGGDFLEGAWESVSTGAQNALGSWASGDDDGNSPAANVNSGQDANATTTGQSTATSQPVLFGLDQQSLMIGAGVLLAVILVLKK
ncbi:hypothetical protein [Neptunicella sp. SCSIO 80796]|uniref:hypothetical protein n=1 Tax=Neptunicella plasticusilytica TaxID=3117012 RepID=UPI003A4D709F